MQKEEVFDKVVSLIKPFARDEVALANVGMETRILQDLKVNSARLVDIVIAFEDEFGVSIDDEAAEKVSTIGEIVGMILEKAAERGA